MSTKRGKAAPKNVRRYLQAAILRAAVTQLKSTLSPASGETTECAEFCHTRKRLEVLEERLKDIVAPPKKLKPEQVTQEFIALLEVEVSDFERLVRSTKKPCCGSDETAKSS